MFIIEILNSVDEMVDALNTAVLDVLDKHAPMITKRLTKRKSVPWMSSEIRCMMARRDSLYRRAKRSQNIEIMQQYMLFEFE
jgi:hypothetical protein